MNENGPIIELKNEIAGDEKTCFVVQDNMSALRPIIVAGPTPASAPSKGPRCHESGALVPSKSQVHYLSPRGHISRPASSLLSVYQ